MDLYLYPKEVQKLQLFVLRKPGEFFHCKKPLNLSETSAKPSASGYRADVPAFTVLVGEMDSGPAPIWNASVTYGRSSEPQFPH